MTTFASWPSPLLAPRFQRGTMMNRTSLIASTALVLGALHQPATASSPDWNRIEATELVLFYPGVASIEWILGDLRIDRERHQGARVFKMGDRCVECHSGEVADMGDAIAAGERMEPVPIDGKPGSIPIAVQAAYDDDKLFLRFSWRQPPASGAAKMDAENPLKLAFMLDAGKVGLADQSGCWASCHADSRTMPEADDAKTKYVSGGSLADGVFYDLVQWRSGEGKAYDGHVAEARFMEGGKALKRAAGKLDGEIWSVEFVRRFAGGEGDITLQRGGVYNFGIAIHDDHAAGRFHHVSLGYTLGIDAEGDVVARHD